MSRLLLDWTLDWTLGKRALFGALLVAVLGASGCDDVHYRAGVRDAQPPIFQPQAMRSLVSAQGLETLYEVAYPEGALLEFPAERATRWELDLTLGPMSRHVGVERWQVTAIDDRLDVRIEARDVALIVPVRIEERVGARICRYAVEADHVSFHTTAALSEVDDVPFVEATGEPTVTWSHPTVSLVGSCPPLEEVSETHEFDVDQLFVDYLTRAFEGSGREAVSLSPLDTLGLIYLPVGLSRVSNFENRRGELLLSAQVSHEAALSEDGFNVDLDMALNSKRASCAPALIPEAPSMQSADLVSPAELERADADVGITLSAPLIRRLAQTSTLAGFGCRGLEDVSFDGASSNIAVDDLMLGDVGLGELPVGAWAEPVLSPGSLPHIEMNPQSATVELVWEALTIDFYAPMQGVPVRILQLTAGISVALRPVERLDSVELAVDAVTVSEADIESPWRVETFEDPDRTLWARRVMLLVLQDAFSLPLPMQPGAPLQLVDSQVRSNDLLLLFEIDRPF